jgi:hypothetical protein
MVCASALALQQASGAGAQTRTADLLITNQLLYQLSYTSAPLSTKYTPRRSRRVN